MHTCATITRLRGFLIIGSILTALVWNEAHAGETPPQPGADIAQKLIDHCWAISLDARDSGVTAAMGNGILATIKCLEDTILDQWASVFDLKEVPRDKAVGWLDEIAALRSFYSAIYEQNRSCEPSCGTIQMTRYPAPHAHLLENMLRDLIAVRENETFQMHIWTEEQRKKGKRPN